MWRRLLRAVRLQSAVYREVASARSLAGEALAVAAGASVLASLGLEIRFGGTARTFLVGCAWGFGAWLLGSVITFALGSRLGGGTGETASGGPTPRAALAGLMRSLAYAQAPKALLLLAGVPFLGAVLFLPGAYLWSLAAATVAVREMWGLGTLRALLVAGAGWAATSIVMILAGLLRGALAARL